MKFTLGKNPAKLSPINEQGLKDLSAFRRVAVDCVQCSKKSCRSEGYLPDKSRYTRFALED